MMPLEDIFIDTSAWIALVDKDDSHHKEAALSYPPLLKNCRNLITSNLVIAETYIVIVNELGHKPAIDFLEKLKASPRILKVYSNEDTEEEGELILAKYGDQNFSYTDAVSFVIMKRQRIKKAFCFDKHFLIAGFVSVP